MWPRSKSPEEFYSVFDAFLTDLMQDPELGFKFAEADKAVPTSPSASPSDRSGVENIAAMMGMLPALQPAFTRYEAYLKTNRAVLLG